MKKYNAFSLVEVLITLLVLSLVFTAMIPVFVNSKVSPGEAPWRYVVNGTLSNVAGVYGAASDSSPVVIGANKIPVDSKVAAGDANTLFGKHSPKLMIVTKPEDSETPTARRHLIDFFQANSDGTYSNIGKITFDKSLNVGVGLYSLEGFRFKTFSSPDSDLLADTVYGGKAGISNTAVGAYAMSRISDTSNTQPNLENASTDNSNDAIFGQGSYNVAVGTASLLNNTNGTSNVAVGYRSLAGNTYGRYNTAVGFDAMKGSKGSEITGKSNIAIGTNSLSDATTASNNVAIGHANLAYCTTCANNIAIGHNAGYQNSGNNNILIGAETGMRNNGNNNIIIGNKLESTGMANALAIDSNTDTRTYTGTSALIYGNFENRVVKLNGKTVTVGTSDATQVDIHGTTLNLAKASGSRIYVGSSGSTVYIKGSTYSTSDARLKNIGADFTSGLDKIDKINVKHFTFKDDKTKTPRVGVIAQDLQKIFPNSVTKDDKGFLNINKDEMFYAVINSVKELHQMFTDFCSSIKSSVDSLAAKVVDLDKRVSALEKASCACDCGKNCDCERCACDIGCSCGCDVCKNGTCGCSTGKKPDCKCGCGDSSKVACGCATKKVACSFASAKGCSCAAVKTSKCSSDLNSRLSDLEKQNADLKKQTEELQKQVKFLMSRQK